MRSFVVTLAITLAGISVAHADGALASKMSAADKARMAAFDKTRAQALADARAKGSPADVKVLNDALAGKPLSMAGSFDATGNYRCRTIKTGGTVPLVVYGWFKCSITDDGAGWLLKKTSGSQRTQGRLYTESNTRLVYLGTSFMSDETPPKYGSNAARDQVAAVTRPSERRLRLEFPSPQVESKFDVMLLERL
jgi:hypothetical protein